MKMMSQEPQSFVYSKFLLNNLESKCQLVNRKWPSDYLYTHDTNLLGSVYVVVKFTHFTLLVKSLK